MSARKQHDLFKMNQELTPYALMGGEAAVLSLVERFYFYMDTLPEVQGIRGMHATSLNSAKDKLFKFLSGWLGGPDLFIQAFGHPRLRQRHFPFAIGPQERDQWMTCMDKALNEINMDAQLRERIREALAQLASHMINQGPA